MILVRHPHSHIQHCFALLRNPRETMLLRRQQRSGPLTLNCSDLPLAMISILAIYPERNTVQLYLHDIDPHAK